MDSDDIMSALHVLGYSLGEFVIPAVPLETLAILCVRFSSIANRRSSTSTTPVANLAESIPSVGGIRHSLI